MSCNAPNSHGGSPTIQETIALRSFQMKFRIVLKTLTTNRINIAIYTNYNSTVREFSVAG